MKLSVVTTMYYSQNYLEEFHARMVKTIHTLGADYELIFVDDGSPDRSLETALQIQNRDPKIQIVELSRNFGHHKAIMAGLRETSGDLVFLIDCDLEEAPELLIEFYAHHKQNNCDVVYGVQANRKGNWPERVFGYLFYKLFNYFAYQQIPENVIMTRLMTREYVAALREFDEEEFFLASTFVNVGFVQQRVVVEKKSKGSSTYSLSKKTQLMVNAIVSSSNKPLVFVFYTGALISLSVLIGAIGVFYYHFAIHRMQVGWPSLILSIWFLGGLIILCVGVVGIYLSKVYAETKSRPTVIIRKRHTKI